MRAKKVIFLLIVILLIASFFRLWKLKTLPPGLHPDEAANGLDALLILKGHHTPFFERGQGREALFFYLLATSIYFFGIGVWQIHLISALIGIFTVLACWFLAKKYFNTRVAFFASLFLAGSAWHTTLSRTGFRAILIPLFSTLFFYFAYSFIKEKSKTKRRIFAVLSGIAFGLGFYTYIPFRAMVFIVGFLALIILFSKRKLYKNFWKEIIFSLTAAFIVDLPLIVYFIYHPKSFFGRAGAVSILNPELNKGDIFGTFLTTFKKTILMFFTAGDLNWRHNVSGFSILDPFVASLFAVGFIISLSVVFKKIIKREQTSDYLKHLLLIVWFCGMLLPELVSAEGIPHSLRAIGIIPPVFIFPALTLNFLWKRIKILLKNKTNKIFLGITLFLSLVSGLFYNYCLYFLISANSPGFHYAYRADLTKASEYLNEINQKEKTYLALDEYSVQTVEFLSSKTNQPYILVEPDKIHQLNFRPGDKIIFVQKTIFELKKTGEIFNTEKFEKYHPEAKLIKVEKNQFGKEIMKVYEIHKAI